jgi:HEAT repeat protein
MSQVLLSETASNSCWRQLLAFCVALLLAGCGSQKIDHSVAGLTKTLKDKDPNMRYWAAETLGHHGRKAREAVPALADALKDEEAMVRMGAAYALAEIGPDARSTMPALQQALKDPNKKVREAAAHALKQVQRKR